MSLFFLTLPALVFALVFSVVFDYKARNTKRRDGESHKDAGRRWWRYREVSNTLGYTAMFLVVLLAWFWMFGW